MKHRHLSMPSKARRGAILAQVAIALVVLLGVAAITVDGGLLLTERRHCQATADAAALAAADELYKNFRTGGGAEASNSGPAHLAALAVANGNGFTNDGSVSMVTVKVSPETPMVVSPTIVDSSGRLLPGYVEVIVQYNQPRGFSRLFGGSNVSIRGRAVARGLWVTSPTTPGGQSRIPTIWVGNPTGPGALSTQGNGAGTVTEGAVYVNSNNANAASFSGNNATFTAPEFNIVGGTNRPGSLIGQVNFGTEPIPNPLAYLPTPSPSSLPVQSSSRLSITNTRTLQPGVYTGGISLSGKANVTMAPGIYYMNGGGFSMSGQSTLNAQGVMIYNGGSNPGSVSLSGQGNITISPPTSGTYQGISIFQDPIATNSISLSGNGVMNITGAIYAANATLNVTGNGTGNTNFLGSQYIVKDLNLSGNGNITVGWPSGTGNGGGTNGDAPVGHQRIVQLVE